MYVKQTLYTICIITLLFTPPNSLYPYHSDILASLACSTVKVCVAVDVTINQPIKISQSRVLKNAINKPIQTWITI